MSALALLSGCVAAIPVVAGGALLSRADKISKQKAVAQETELELTEVAAASTLDATPKTASASDKPLLSHARQPAVREPIGELPPTVDGEDQAQIYLLDITELPAPVSARPSAKVSPAIQDANPAVIREKSALPQADAFVSATSPESRAFFMYVQAQAQRDPVSKGRQSALLANPGLLKDDRTDCSIRPPAVLLDLDPQSAVFDTKADPQANPDLSRILSFLRRQDVAIFWISENTAFEAPAIRRHLRETGLDSEGRDPLLLMRRTEDRKQIRRKELGETHCLIAIAGDTRGDFDELFLFLKDPASVGPLERLIGQGWFFIPLPLQEGG